jgi:hypothetical protein
MRKLLFCFAGWLLIVEAGAQKIKGVITDKDGNRISYASVFVRGTTIGTNSNNEGKYSLKLSPGNHTLVCQHVGFGRQEVAVSLKHDQELELNFSLSLQEMTLEEVVLDQKEDPAYQIIRNTIREKDRHQETFNRFSCEVYTKGQLKLRDFPDRIFGQKVDFEDGDTSRKKMLYLSETISNYSVDGGSREKIEVLSSKLSGQSDGFGLSAPHFFLSTGIISGSEITSIPGASFHP